MAKVKGYINFGDIRKKLRVPVKEEIQGNLTDPGKHGLFT